LTWWGHLKLWQVYVGMFLSLWLAFYLLGSPQGEAFAWALIFTMFFGFLIVSIIVIIKGLKNNAELDLDNY